MKEQMPPIPKLRAVINGVDFGNIAGIDCEPRLVGEKNRLLAFEAGQMYIDFVDGRRLEIVREIGYRVDEQAGVVIYTGPVA